MAMSRTVKIRPPRFYKYYENPFEKFYLQVYAEIQPILFSSSSLWHEK